MSRGRKSKDSVADFDEKRIFNKCLGFYVQSIIVNLEGKVRNDVDSQETGHSLLSRIRESKGKIPLPVEDFDTPFTIPSHWAWCKLGEIVEFSENLNIEARLSQETLVNYVDIDSIDNENFLIREVKVRPVSALSSRARRVLKKGFILYSLVRPYLNNIATIPDDRKNFIGSTGFAVFNGIYVSNEYLKLILLADFTRRRYLDLISGFNSPSITQEDFSNSLIPLPPINEQEGIVSFLNDLRDNKIEHGKIYFNKDVEEVIVKTHKFQVEGHRAVLELENQLALVKDLRQAFLREAMQGQLVPQDEADEPAAVLLERIKAEKEKLVAAKKMKREKPVAAIKDIPFEIPGTWAWCRLGDICEDTEGGKSPNCKNEPAKEDQWGVIKTTAIQTYQFFEDQNKVLSEDFEVNPKIQIMEGDVLITRAGPTNRVGIVCYVNTVRGKLILSDKTIRIKYIKNHISPQFLALALNTEIPQSFMKTKMVGMAVSQVNISQDNMKLTPLALPPLAEQKRIVEKLEKLMAYCDELEANIRQSKAQAESLLQVALKEALEPQ